MILTDAEGRPIPRPERDDFETHVEFLRALHTFHDRVADVANRAFVDQFRQTMKRTT